jgi:hypothetical protein
VAFAGEEARHRSLVAPVLGTCLTRIISEARFS